MKQRPFGNQQTSVIGQGTWNIERADRVQAIAAIRHGLDLGMTHIDTAEMYGSGKAEEIVGEAIAGKREQVFLVSKVLPSNASRTGTIAACERSLQRLQTDYLDCYLLHWHGSYPLADTFAGMEQLLRIGKIRSFGVSNFDVDDLDEAEAILGRGKMACNQVDYHVQERAIEHHVIPWCEQHGVTVVAYSPFGQGNFPSPASPGGKLLADIGKKHGGATARQVALAFLVRRESVLAIPKAASPKHLEENAGAADLVLTPEDVQRIDEAFPRGKLRPLPML